jgi:hypothetical protein
MKCPRASAVVLFLCVSAHLAAQTKGSTTPAGRPSLDMLAARIDSYWNLLLQRKKQQAVEYIAPSDRETFFNSSLPPFKDPRLKLLELSGDRTEATATVIVKRLFFPMGQEMEWPVTEHWRFEKGNWYRQFKGSSLPLQGEKGKGLPPPTPGELENAKREIREMLRFEKAVLDFGTVSYRDAVSIKLKYSLAGNAPMEAGFKSLPPAFLVQGLLGNALKPGEQELTIEFSASNYDGAVKERLVLVAYRQGADVPFEIVVQGNVYVPVSIIPRLLRLRKGDQEKEFLVRNNTDTEVELKGYHSETGMIVIEPLLASIPAGKELKMKVKARNDIGAAQQDSRDNVGISFSRPVDGMSSLILTVVLNPSAAKREAAFDPAKSKEIQELIRKSKVNLPKR